MRSRTRRGADRVVPSRLQRRWRHPSPLEGFDIDEPRSRSCATASGRSYTSATSCGALQCLAAVTPFDGDAATYEQRRERDDSWQPPVRYAVGLFSLTPPLAEKLPQAVSWRAVERPCRTASRLLSGWLCPTAASRLLNTFPEA